jgi:large subunit ribosomal protein L9e
MKFREARQTLDIPEGVTVEIKARVVTVKGPRGTLKKDFRHQPVEMELQGSRIELTKWTGTKSQISTLQTFVAHIKNMFIGVTQGFRYKMRYVYAHFPINVGVEKDGKLVEVRNFLGEKRVRKVTMRNDTKAVISKVKDELILEGNDIEAVTQTAADIHRSTKVLGKDLRKFLDGIYVSEGGPIVAEVA